MRDEKNTNNTDTLAANVADARATLARIRQARKQADEAARTLARIETRAAELADYLADRLTVAAEARTTAPSTQQAAAMLARTVEAYTSTAPATFTMPAAVAALIN